MGYLSCNAESAIATCDPYLAKKQRNAHKKKNTFVIREFSYLDLQSATNGFSSDSFLGKGSHGSVYKAVLDDGKLIAAVKKTTATDTVNSPAENEIEILSRIRNPRLVNLLGFGVDSSERRLIVVEFMPNGSLYDLLHNVARPPGWARRVRFALQVAKAVQYLHSSNPPVIHRDIKSSNVLIDGDWNARLGDFGLALRGHVEDVRVKCTPPAGTLGYLDPSYLAPGDLSTKSDVFSFGILLLEMISGRNAIDMNYSPPSVVDWAATLIKGCDFAGLCDPRIGPPVDAAVVRQLAVLAARCVKSAAEKRPEMSAVVDCLRVVEKKVKSPIWNNINRRVMRSSTLIKYEPLDDSTEMIKTSRVGSRRNRKVSSVPGVELASKAIGTCNDRVGHIVPRSKSVGSVREIKTATHDSNLGGCKRRGGLAVKRPIVRLSKSRSMGMLQGTCLGNNNGCSMLQIKRNSSVGELEEFNFLIELEEDLVEEPKKNIH
ncbi:serine/threonine-protein kinase-like protein At3g51990 [Cornus florida]|uniref:serine/threonine-protein kinase-like protein At3g51990 n=1 Tax=Cornus florida TaxID=4283 RepID=UPI00289A1C12|nr:serine/threonine-protein kinase-like protein At3g51990 [Cornus florida]